MKVLIIEDNKSKLEQAVSILQRNCITAYVHFNNVQEAVKFIRRGNIEDIDFIILDLFFYLYRPYLGKDGMRSSTAGARILHKMLEIGVRKPVIVFSREEDYMTSLNVFFFPNISEYNEKFGSTSSLSVLSDTHRKYNEYLEYIEKNTLLLSKLDFLVGHAHDEEELENLIAGFIKSVNSKE